MPTNQAGEATSSERGAELLGRGTVYFDTSAWNQLADHSDRDGVITSLRARHIVVLGSVISAGEILKTPDLTRREQLCSVMLSVSLGDRALLEPPLALAKAAAEAVLRGEADVLLQQTGSGRTFHFFLAHPHEADVPAIEAWLGNSDANLERFRVLVEPDEPSRTRFCTPDVLASDAFLRCLLMVPPAVELGLTLAQVRDLCGRADIWRALAGALAGVIAQVLTRAPKKKKGRRRPGAPDLWQAVYLGVAEVFVTGDERQLEAVSEVSVVLKHPRCVVFARDFFAALDPTSAQAGRRCGVCGCVVRAAGGGLAGFHASPA